MNGGSLIIAIVVWVFVSFFVKAAKQSTASRSPNPKKVQPSPGTRIDAEVTKKRLPGFAEEMRPFSADSDARARFASYDEVQDISTDPLEMQTEPSAPSALPGLRLSFQASDAVQGIVYAEILARKAPIPRNRR